MIGHKTNRKGQILLIAVMLLATVIAIVMTIAFNTTSETQLSKLEEDSQKALAAADAGVQAALQKSGAVNIATLGGFSTQGITGNATVQTVTQKYFVSPLLEKDEQYTFYLADYPGLTTPWNGTLDVLFNSESGQCISIEIMVLKSNNTLEKYAYNTSCGATITNAALASQQTTTLDGTTFQWNTGNITVANSVFMVVRVYGGRTKLGFQSATTNLPLQGKSVTSEARTQSGVVKKVQLFQSYPQLPASFFATSF